MRTDVCPVCLTDDCQKNWPMPGSHAEMHAAYKQQYDGLRNHSLTLRKEIVRLNKALRRRRLQRKRVDQKLRDKAEQIRQKDLEIKDLGNACISFQNL